MKYFEKLPKINYETTAGTFTVTTPYAYYKFDVDSILKQDYAIDAKTTLLEAGAMLYKDANSFWLFLLANKKINPFDLVPTNVQIFNKQSEDKYTFNVSGSTANQYVVLGKQSVLVKYDPTKSDGITATYGETGPWDVYGDFALVESTNAYNKKITVKPVQGTSGDLIIGTSGISPLLGFNYSTVTDSYATSTKSLTAGTATQYISSNAGSRIPSTGETVIESIADEVGPTTPTAVDYTVSDVLIETPKTVKAFLPGQVSKIFNNLIYIKYS
jgi:hypothetical protein